MASYEELNAFVLSNTTTDSERRPRRNTIKIINSFSDLTDEVFIKNFRLTKDLARDLIEIVTPHMKAPSRSSALSVEYKVLASLNFLGTGSYQMPVGNNINVNISQPSVSRALSEFVEVLTKPEIFNTWVKFPSTLEELKNIRNRFYSKYRFPGIIGCIDCTHVAIVPPANNPLYPEYTYVNRKNYHSINVQLICDENLKFLNVNALFPGSTHDAHIWNCSNVETTLTNLYRRGHEGFFLIGDSGYPLRPWLLTATGGALSNTPEERYNKAIGTIRATIERCNGVLKMRFRCLNKQRVLHYMPEKATKIINACVVLHNMCVANNFELPNYLEDNNMDLGMMDPLVTSDVANAEQHRDLGAGRILQRRIIDNYYT